MIKECMEVDFARVDVRDEVVAKKLWEESDKLIEKVEREEAVKRALIKKEKETAEKMDKEKEARTVKGENGKVKTDEASTNTQGKKSSRRARKAA